MRGASFVGWGTGTGLEGQCPRNSLAFGWGAGQSRDVFQKLALTSLKLEGLEGWKHQPHSGSPEPCPPISEHHDKSEFQINNKHTNALYNLLTHTHTQPVSNQRLSFLPDRLLPERSANWGVFPQGHREQGLFRPAQTQPLSQPGVGMPERPPSSSLSGLELRAGLLGAVQPPQSLIYLGFGDETASGVECLTLPFAPSHRSFSANGPALNRSLIQGRRLWPPTPTSPNGRTRNSSATKTREKWSLG